MALKEAGQAQPRSPTFDEVSESIVIYVIYGCSILVAENMTNTIHNR